MTLRRFAWPWNESCLRVNKPCCLDTYELLNNSAGRSAMAAPLPLTIIRDFEAATSVREEKRTGLAVSDEKYKFPGKFQTDPSPQAHLRSSNGPTAADDSLDGRV
jgi:hypothetical protein